MSGPVPATVALEAHQIVSEREKAYGPMVESWNEIAALTDSLASPDDSPGERAVLQLLLMKLVRRKHSPMLRDTYADACGYLSVLWRMKEARP